MLHLALSKLEYDAYLEALTSSHAIRIDVRVHDRDEKVISSLTSPTSRVVAGAVQVDSTATVTRSLSLTLIDPHRRLKFDANSPARGAIYADRFISVRYEVRVQEIGQWVVCPIFWGPITSYGRAGGEVTIEAQGKESLLLEPYFVSDGYTIPKRTRIDEAIRMVAERMGERRFDLPDLDHKLGRARTIHPRAESWKIINGGKAVRGFQRRQTRDPKENDNKPAQLERAPGLLAHSPGERKAYYNGHGDLTVRHRDKSVSIVFREGVHIVEPPEVTFDLSEFRNRVVVKGGNPTGTKRIHATAHLPAINDLSPAALARNGVPRRATEWIDAEGVRTVKKAEDQAKRVLNRVRKQTVEAQFTILPIPHLEEDDLVALRTEEDGYVEFPLKQFTIPLTAGETMSINWLKKIRTGPLRRRHRHDNARSGVGFVSNNNGR